MKGTRTTPSQENYIEWIYRLSLRGAVRPAGLAEQLGVKRPSVTRAVASLAEKGLVEHEPFGEIHLTRDGTALGKAIVRRDECLTALLVEVLGMDPREADPEVHRLEHVLSDEVLRRLEALVDCALASDEWRAGLRRRIGRAAASPKAPLFTPGSADIHPGLASEKGDEALA